MVSMKFELIQPTESDEKCKTRYKITNMMTAPTVFYRKQFGHRSSDMKMSLYITVKPYHPGS